MELIEIEKLQKDLYNRFVMDNETGSFLQAWEWGDWQKQLGRQVQRFWIKGEGQLIASIQLVQMPLPFGKFYLYAPYGPVVSGELRVMSNELLNQMKEKFIGATFIRIEPKHLAFSTNDLALHKSPNIQPGKTLIVDLTQSPEELLAQMHPKTRYNIKLAQKHGVRVEEEFAISAGHGLFFQEAIELICQTAKRQGFFGHSAEYYQNLVDFFALQNASQVKAHIYKAIFQNQLLASAIMLDFGQTRTFLFGGSGEFHKQVMAPYLLHFQAMLDAKAAGFNSYDFWGAETSKGDAPGFVRFKMGFAPPSASSSGLRGQLRSGSASGIKEYAGAYDLICQPAGYRIYQALRLVNRYWR